MAKPGKIPNYRKMYPEASEEVIAVLRETERKMQYQEYDLKSEKVVIHPKTKEVVVRPSREDSYERLLNEGIQIIDESKNVEAFVYDKIQRTQLYQVLKMLSEEERFLIYQIFFEGRSERELAKNLGISQKAVNKRRKKILRKLYGFLKKNYFLVLKI